MSRRADFAARLTAGAPLAGMFQKFPAYQAVELLGQTGLDFAVLDAEHAPFDPSQIDMSILASQAVDLPLLVRVPRNAPDVMLSVLDMGASGVFVPHVASAESARAAVDASRYAGGGRGLSPSTRAGRYGGRDLHEHMAAADRETVVILQIEDAQALDALDAIATTPGIGGLFVGRADLAASMGLDWADPQLDEATHRIAAAAARAGVPAGSYLGEATKAANFLKVGLSFFVIGSDQGALKTECARTAAAFRSAVEQGQNA